MIEPADDERGPDAEDTPPSPGTANTVSENDPTGDSDERVEPAETAPTVAVPRSTEAGRRPVHVHGAPSPTDTTDTQPLAVGRPTGLGTIPLPTADDAAQSERGTTPTVDELGQDGTLQDGTLQDNALQDAPGGGSGSDDTLRVPRDSKPRLAIAALLLAALTFGLSLLSITDAPRLSALDEATHVDYAYRLAHGELTFAGEPLSDYTLHSWACRQQANITTMPACDSALNQQAFPGNGLQYNAFHPPLYYAITGYAAQALTAITGQDFITMARAISGVWLFLGTFALYLTLRYWRVGYWWALGGGALVPLTPVLLHSGTIVSNDAPMALAGTAALFVLGRHLIYRNYGWLVPVLTMVATASTKVIGAMALAAVGVMLVVVGIIRWRTEGSRVGLKLIRNGALMGISLAAVHFSWQALQDSRTLPGYINPIETVNTSKIVANPVSEWLPTIFSGARLGDNYYLDPLVNNAYLQAWAIFLSTILATAGFVGVALFARQTAPKVAAATLLVGLVLYPLVVQVQTWKSGNYFPEVTTRYGISLLPLAIGVLVLIAENKKLRITSMLVLLGGLVGVGTATLGILQ